MIFHIILLNSKNKTMSNKNASKKDDLEIYQSCKNIECNEKYNLDEMVMLCKKCGSQLEYKFKGNYSRKIKDRTDLWKNFELIPLQNTNNIISLGVGGSKIISLEEVSNEINGANIFLMCDMMQNPTGTFKDREASIILSRCKEMGLDNLVFYSTANTGRAYTHFAAHLGLTTYMFMPMQCAFKNTDRIKKNKNNFIIYVDDRYSDIAPFTKLFAKKNNLTSIAPMHDRIESYATVAYEQFQQLPNCDYFVQTIASGMGPIGFFKGHTNLVELKIQERSNIPKLICIQSEESGIMAKAYNEGWEKLSKEDLPVNFSKNMFEPTLNSTNPVNNYPDLKNVLNQSKGTITSVDPILTMKHGMEFVQILKRRGIVVRPELEKSLLIEYAGIVKLAKSGKFKKGDNILMLACGRGNDNSESYLEPNAIINVGSQDPEKLFVELHKTKSSFQMTS